MDKETKIIVFAIFLCLLLISFILVGVFKSKVEYDKKLIVQFLVNKWVHITIKIHDVSNITISKDDSIEVQTTKDNERISILNNISDSILLTFSEDEFKLEGKFPIGNGFYGDITKEGFEKLLKDSRVKKIYAEKHITLHSS